MSYGEHRECSGVAGSSRVKRVGAVGVALAMWVVMLPSHMVTAAVSEIVPESIARSFPTQVTGISGFSSPNDGVPWGLDRIDQRTPISAVAAQRSYTYSSGTTGAGVTVYVVDSGVQANHTDFGGRVVKGWSYRANLGALNSYRLWRNAYDIDSEPDPEKKKGIAPCSATYTFEGISTIFERQFDPADFDGPSTIDADDFGTTDNNGHGTHVAGIVAGTLAGVAKEATIVPVRVLDSCGVGNPTMMLNGLNWIVQQHTAGTKAVVNLSLGFPVTVKDVDTVIAQMINKGMVVVAAAGNDGESSCGTTPAGTQGTFSVGASLTQNVNGSFVDREAPFSNYGDCVDMFAPGAEIASPWSHLQIEGRQATPNPFLTLSGTSMAAPHVSGVLARYLHTVSLPANANASVSANAWAWTQLHATCNAVAYFPTINGRTMQTPNRLLAMEAPVGIPCAPRTVTATPEVDAATFTWNTPFAHNGELPSYEVVLSPGGSRCVTTRLTCTVSGLRGDTQYVVSVVTRNSAGVSSAATTTVTPIPSVSQLQLTPGDGVVTATWSAVGNLTFTAVLSPGDIRCVTTATSCVFTGLVNNQTYSVTVQGANATGASSVQGEVAPNGVPTVPSQLRVSTGVGRVTFRWSPITNSAQPIYIVSSSDGRHRCETTATSCTIRGLPNGKARTFSLTTRTVSGGPSLTRTSVRAWAGFKVRQTTLRRSSRVSLSAIVSPVSRGAATWSSSPACRINGAFLVTSSRRATCYLTVRVRAVGKTPQMSTRVKLSIR
jgi:hypothetical protein